MMQKWSTDGEVPEKIDKSIFRSIYENFLPFAAYDATRPNRARLSDHIELINSENDHCIKSFHEMIIGRRSFRIVGHFHIAGVKIENADSGRDENGNGENDHEEVH